MKIKRMCISGALLAGSVAISVFGAVPGPGYEQLVQELENSANPAVRPSPRVPVNQAWLDAHAARQLLLDADNGNFEYFIVGDSITAGWSSSGQEELNNLFGAGKVMNLGQSADKTEHIIWRLLDHNMIQSNPKVAMVLAGTNNSNNDEYTDEQIAGGVQAIVRVLRAKLPQTKVLLLGIFPRGSYEQRIALQNGLTEAVMNPQWEKINRVNQIIETFADGTNVVYLNINAAFLNENGALPISIMPDLLHPNATGYGIWANAVKPTIMTLAEEQTASAKIGVDWGGSYGNNFTSSLNQGLGSAVTSAGDYTFDAVSDAAYSIPFGTAYSPSADSRYLAPAGKTGPLYTGLQKVNHSSAVTPTAGIYKWTASTATNQLQKTNPGVAGTGIQSMSTAYFSKKADFLNGLNWATAIGFADATDAASVSMSTLRVGNSGKATIAFVVQEGSDWYATVATNRVSGSDFSGAWTVNPYTADWYAFNPASNQFLNVTNLGPAKAGATFKNITAFGITGQILGYDGSIANSQKLDFTGFSFTAVPEPTSVILTYDEWLSGYNVGVQTNLTDDFDGDLMNNLVEYSLGGNPAISDASVKLPTVVLVSNVIAYVYNRRLDAAARSLIYTVETTTNLVGGTWITNGVTLAGTGAVDLDFESVTNTIPVDVDQRFLKLKIELN